GARRGQVLDAFRRLWREKFDAEILRIHLFFNNSADNDHEITLYSNAAPTADQKPATRSEEHTSELQSRFDLVCRLLLEKKNTRSNDSLCNLNEARCAKRNRNSYRH